MNAVEFEGVSKNYAIYDKPADRLRELLPLSRRRTRRNFAAVTDVSFQIRRGEVFCLVGPNGAGKSTVLQMVAGILQPTSGSVKVNGRIAALLELGAGFNHEFSGRDNVYLNGALMGLDGGEIRRRFHEIEEFAEIGDFIDKPVKTYSSGMIVRLAFAVAIHVDPDILLVDEALAVGDGYFRHKCMRKVHDLRSRGLTILFVSHSSADILAIGDRVLWLESGKVRECGDAAPVLAHYLAHMGGQTDRPSDAADASVTPLRTIPNIDHRRGDERARICGIAVLDEYDEPVHLMQPNTRVVVRVTVEGSALLAKPDAGLLIRNHLGMSFGQVRTSLGSLGPGEEKTVDFTIDLPELYPGAFSFSPWIADGEECDFIDNAITLQMARGEGPVYGFLHQPCHVAVPTAEAVIG